LRALKQHVFTPSKCPLKDHLALADEWPQLGDLFREPHSRIALVPTPHNFASTRCANTLSRRTDRIEHRLLELDIRVLNDHSVRINAKTFCIELVCCNLLEQFGRIDYSTSAKQKLRFRRALGS